jgi:hypothetical protein
LALKLAFERANLTIETPMTSLDTLSPNDLANALEHAELLVKLVKKNIVSNPRLFSSLGRLNTAQTCLADVRKDLLQSSQPLNAVTL